jgi:hypothetical protein
VTAASFEFASGDPVRRFSRLLRFLEQPPLSDSGSPVSRSRISLGLSYLVAGRPEAAGSAFESAIGDTAAMPAGWLGKAAACAARISITENCLEEMFYALDRGIEADTDGRVAWTMSAVPLAIASLRLAAQIGERMAESDALAMQAFEQWREGADAMAAAGMAAAAGALSKSKFLKTTGYGGAAAAGAYSAWKFSQSQQTAQKRDAAYHAAVGTAWLSLATIVALKRVAERGEIEEVKLIFDEVAPQVCAVWAALYNRELAAAAQFMATVEASLGTDEGVRTALALNGDYLAVAEVAAMGEQFGFGGHPVVGALRRFTGDIKAPFAEAGAMQEHEGKMAVRMQVWLVGVLVGAVGVTLAALAFLDVVPFTPAMVVGGVSWLLLKAASAIRSGPQSRMIETCRQYRAWLASVQVTAADVVVPSLPGHRDDAA